MSIKTKEMAKPGRLYSEMQQRSFWYATHVVSACTSYTTGKEDAWSNQMTLTSSQFLLVLNHETNKIRLERWIIKLEYTYINQIRYFVCSILVDAFCCWYKSSVAYVIVTLPISLIGQNFCPLDELTSRPCSCPIHAVGSVRNMPWS